MNPSRSIFSYRDEAAKLRVCPSNPPKVTGYLVGVSGVLYDNSTWRRWFLQLLRSMGMHTSYEPFFRLWSRDYAPAIYQDNQDYWVVMAQYLRACGLSQAQTREVTAAAQPRQSQVRRDTRLLPGVRTTLQKLAEYDVPLGIVSANHWHSDQIASRLRQLRIDKYIRCVRALADFGPDFEPDACFAAALSDLGCDSANIGFVGCEPIGLEAAHNLGIHTIAFNAPIDVEADEAVDRFELLLTRTTAFAQAAC